MLPNGDLLLAIFTSWNEYEPEMSILFARLRFGADQWDMPSSGVNMPGACDNAPLLWTDRERVYLFWGSTGALGGFPFQWVASRDSGATWGEVNFPRFTTAVGPHSRQPINTAVRDRNGTIYVPCDGQGATSVTWVSRDDMKTWADPGGRTGGRHTTLALLKDGRTLLGMGGKSSDIEGYMPQAVSSDGGKTWTLSKTVFPAYSSNQRPCVLRLASGRLFFCGDFQSRGGEQPAGVTNRGAFVALSDDDGRTWRLKTLAGTQPHETPGFHKGAGTIGYSVARQSRDGVIHVVTTMNKPCLHLAFNEAWILSGDPTPSEDALLMANSAREVRNVKRYEEKAAPGRPRMVWHAGVGDDGRYLLHGQEEWFGPDGRLLYQATHALGRKTGREVLHHPEGGTRWEWMHREDGNSVWTQFWPDGRPMAESQWRGKVAQGPAVRWDREGRELSRVAFSGGELSSAPAKVAP